MMLLNFQKNGVPVSEKVARHMHTDYDKMLRFENLKNLYLNDGQPYAYGDIVYNKDYAKSLRYLKEHGRDGFYKGELADKIVAYSHAHGGLFEKEDFEKLSL